MFDRFLPAQSRLSPREQVLAALAAGLTIALNAWLSRLLLPGEFHSFLAASMGASTILALVVYHSPFSQPWAILGGHFVSVASGLLAHALVSDLVWACALAMSLAVVLQLNLRCLHPPGGGTALLPVLGGAAIQSEGLAFAGVVLLNAVVLVLAALFFNNLMPGRRYPLAFFPAHPAPHSPSASPRFTSAELRDALNDLDEIVDVTPDDMNTIFELALSRKRRGAR